MSDKIVALVAMLALFAAFLAAPPLIALVRKHPERKLIYKLTPLTIFSFILWVALIVWAASDKRDDAVISRYVARLRGSGRLSWVVGAIVLVGVAGSVVTFSLR
ncbi:hypothetical protein [Altererythrobacter sp. Root672]|uniref:hypothetical protein n=1 Tax=Altererythrobacter sp. Root672 TaxID=1736584 RepID=UPI000AA47994|nr:hypothetical protein [Altererythrobacter sp. Root672]